MAWPSWVSKCRIGNLDHFSVRIWVLSVSFSNEILHSGYWFWKMWHLQLQLKWTYAVAGKSPPKTCSRRSRQTLNLPETLREFCHVFTEKKRNGTISLFDVSLSISFCPHGATMGPFPNLKVLRGGEMTVSKIMIGHRLNCGSKRVNIKWTFKCHGSSRISCFILVDWFVSGWLNQTMMRHVRTLCI